MKCQFCMYLIVQAQRSPFFSILVKMKLAAQDFVVPKGDSHKRNCVMVTKQINFSDLTAKIYFEGKVCIYNFLFTHFLSCEIIFILHSSRHLNPVLATVPTWYAVPKLTQLFSPRADLIHLFFARGFNPFIFSRRFFISPPHGCQYSFFSLTS